jgi:hypothetical protein
MHSACGDVEDIAGMHLVPSEYIADGAVLYASAVFLLRDVVAETGEECRSGFGIYDVPHFRLAEGVVALCREGVVGVNLNGEVAIGLNKLYEEGHLAAILIVNGLSEKGSSFLRDDGCKVSAGKRSVGDNGNAGRHRRCLPTFRSPHKGVEVCFK